MGCVAREAKRPASSSMKKHMRKSLSYEDETRSIRLPNNHVENLYSIAKASRVYTEVLYFYLQPSASMVVSFPSLSGHVCPKGGHTCSPKLVKKRVK